ncbi:MAG: peroxiredoxin, partial [Gemmatimonadales bacterium]
MSINSRITLGLSVVATTMIFAASASSQTTGTPAAPAAGTPAVAPIVPPPPPEVDVGRMAPDFTMQWADSSGVRGTPFTLSKLRGKVVVLAFYPADRSSGCTAELIKFRDEYAKMFGGETVVIPISVDSLGSHASWAQEMKFPFALGTDPQLAVAKQYGSWNPAKTYASRTVFVIGKDGRILWRNL